LRCRPSSRARVGRLGACFCSIGGADETYVYPRVQVYRASDLSGSAVPAYRRCRPRVNTEQEPGDCAVQVAPPPVSSRDRQEASSVGRF